MSPRRGPSEEHVLTIVQGPRVWSKSKDTNGGYRSLDVTLPHSGAFPGSLINLYYANDTALFMDLDAVNDMKFVLTKK